MKEKVGGVGLVSHRRPLTFFLPPSYSSPSLFMFDFRRADIHIFQSESQRARGPCGGSHQRGERPSLHLHRDCLLRRCQRQSRGPSIPKFPRGSQPKLRIRQATRRLVGPAHWRRRVVWGWAVPHVAVCEGP
jgi:hypothetical protein